MWCTGERKNTLFTRLCTHTYKRHNTRRFFFRVTFFSVFFCFLQILSVVVKRPVKNPKSNNKKEREFSQVSLKAKEEEEERGKKGFSVIQEGRKKKQKGDRGRLLYILFYL